MRTHLFGTLELDEARLADDLRRAASLPLVSPYSEFSCGRPWRSCMLWAPGGEMGDGVLDHYDTTVPAGPTAHLGALPYVREILESSFAVEHLLFVRWAVMEDSVLLPHRDYVEFSDLSPRERASCRLHVPLATDEDCLFIEDDVVFRMTHGEVWMLDVSRLHSAGVLSDRPRVHLLLDFAGVDDVSQLLRFRSSPEAGIPPARHVQRPAITRDEHDAVLRMATLLDQQNLYEILGILVRKSFRRDCGDGYVWSTMSELASRAGRREVEALVDRLHIHCALERCTSTVGQVEASASVNDDAGSRASSSQDGLLVDVNLSR